MKLKEDHTSVVFIGSFNPRIFHPSWMALHDILTPTECEAALDTKAGDSGGDPNAPKNSVIVTEPISQTIVAGLNIVAEVSRLVITATTQERHMRPLEIALAVARALPHSPVSAIGLNRNFVLDMAAEAPWHKIGHTVVQKAPFWNSIGVDPGTINASVRYRKCNVDNAQLNLVVAPVPEAHAYAVHVNCNYHFTEPPIPAVSESKIIPERKDSFRMYDFSALLTQELWDSVLVDAFSIAEKVDALGGSS